MTAAQKANQTRTARKLFRERYPQTARAAEDILRGSDSSVVAILHRLELTQVAAIRANLNRYGEYSQMAHRCNW
jgi:ribosomal 50S subunit-associated protein YjgA (DUF615 family)